MLGLILPWWTRWAALALAMVAAAAFGAAKMHQHDAKRYDALQVKFTAFVDKVRTEGLQAKAAAKLQEATDKKRKEDADRENSEALATLAGTIKRLRSARDSSGSITPPTPAASKCPDGQACFDRAELERALRQYRTEVRQLVDEGSAVTVDLDSAKKWATGRMAGQQTR